MPIRFLFFFFSCLVARTPTGNHGSGEFRRCRRKYSLGVVIEGSRRSGRFKGEEHNRMEKIIGAVYVEERFDQNATNR